MSSASDTVDHPAHYNASPSGIETIDVVEHMNFCLGNAVKYIWRAGLKGGEAQTINDLEKARWYLDREIARLKKQTALVETVKKEALFTMTPKEMDAMAKGAGMTIAEVKFYLEERRRKAEKGNK
jgi:hypothetical protein